MQAAHNGKGQHCAVALTVTILYILTKHMETWLCPYSTGNVDRNRNPA